MIFKKTVLKLAAAALSLTLLAACSTNSNQSNSQNSSKNQSGSAISSDTNTNTNSNSNSNSNNSNTNSNSSSSPKTDDVSVIYKNNQYGFSFTLPKSWSGYSIIDQIWEGNDVKLGKITETGALISIRHPQWTSKNPRQDIPIMVFTLAQWNLIQQGKISIGAAPIGPSELGRNNVYVFTLPARYNFAFLTGYKEVEDILKNKPLKAVNITVSSDSQKDMLLNMMQLAKQGKIINCNFTAKTTNMDTVIKEWQQADKSVYVTAAKGTYATYGYHNVVFGYNKGLQIFEARSYDARLKNISLTKVKQVLGTPAYDSKTSSEEIIGYKAGTEFKIEMVFSLPTTSNPNPAIDHYNVLYPRGTVNSMADDPGRQW